MRAAHPTTGPRSSPPSQAAPTRSAETTDRDAAERATERFEGTFRGRHDGVAPTGRSVCLDFVRVLKVRDGKHVSLKLMFDRLLMLEQLGLV